jgi:CCR4-NOT transcriptional regulation complex NOT5 subunit
MAAETALTETSHMANGAGVADTSHMAAETALTETSHMANGAGVADTSHMAAETAVPDASRMTRGTGVPASIRVTASTMAAARGVAPRRARKHKQASSQDCSQHPRSHRHLRTGILHRTSDP